MNNTDAWCIDKPSERAVLNLLADLRLARKIGLMSIVFGAGSKLNCLLHTAERPIVERWSPERSPRAGDRWTCSSSETRMGRAWVVDRVDRFQAKRKDDPSGPTVVATIVVFRDPDDAEHSCHVGASQLKCDGWSPVPEETLRLTAEVLDFMRSGPAALTSRLEATCLRHVPPVVGEDRKAYEARAAEALVAAEWSIRHSVADAEAMLAKPRKADASATETTAAGTRLDVAEGEYWEAPTTWVSCRVWRVRTVWRFVDGDNIVCMEDPRPDSPVGMRSIVAATMERDGWRRCRLPKPGERWVCSTRRTRSGEPWVAAQSGLSRERLLTGLEVKVKADTSWWFRDPSDGTNNCEVTPSHLGEWSPAIECCPGWQGWVEIFQTLMPPQAHVVRCHVCRKYPDDASLAAAVGDAGQRVVHPTALWSRGEPEDRFYGFVKPEQRDAYERGEPGPFPRLLRPEAAALPQVGEMWVGPAGRVWRIKGRHGPDIVAETRHDGRMSKAILLSRLLTEWRRATPAETERVCDARDWIVVDKTPGPR